MMVYSQEEMLIGPESRVDSDSSSMPEELAYKDKPDRKPVCTVHLLYSSYIPIV